MRLFCISQGMHAQLSGAAAQDRSSCSAQVAASKLGSAGAMTRQYSGANLPQIVAFMLAGGFIMWLAMHLTVGPSSERRVLLSAAFQTRAPAVWPVPLSRQTRHNSSICCCRAHLPAWESSCMHASNCACIEHCQRHCSHTAVAAGSAIALAWRQMSDRVLRANLQQCPTSLCIL